MMMKITAGSEEEQAKPGMMMMKNLNEHQETEQDTDLPFPPMRRSSSFYSLTIDEVQNAVCEPGKSFGSMNMDELIASIWNAEDDQQPLVNSSSPAAAGIQCQNSLTVPATLSRKTVEEVWSEIHRNEQRPSDNLNRPSSADTPLRQQTLGEMTLEDFLVKAGVVYHLRRAPSSPAQHYAMMSFSMGSSEAHGVYGGEIIISGENEYSGGFGSPASSVSPDMMEVEPSEADQEFRGLGARKRAAAVEKVAERRQRRMIKNRESAARSRARKQAYTVELEQELTQLKEENARLRAEEMRALELRKELIIEIMETRAENNAARKMDQTLRRCNTCRW